MSRADDDVEDAPVQPLQSNGPSTSAGAEAISDLLLEMLSVCVKLKWLLSEVDEAEFRVIRARLRALKTTVKDLPDTAPARRRVGFRVQSRRRK